MICIQSKSRNGKERWYIKVKKQSKLAPQTGIQVDFFPYLEGFSSSSERYYLFELILEAIEDSMIVLFALVVDFCCNERWRRFLLDEATYWFAEFATTCWDGKGRWHRKIAQQVEIISMGKIILFPCRFTKLHWKFWKHSCFEELHFVAGKRWIPCQHQMLRHWKKEMQKAKKEDIGI